MLTKTLSVQAFAVVALLAVLSPMAMAEHVKGHVDTKMSQPPKALWHKPAVEPRLTWQDRLNKRSPQQQADHKAKRTACKRKWEAMTPEQKAEWKAKHAEHRARWEAMTPEQKAEWKAKHAAHKAKWEAMTPEQKAEWKAKHAEHKEYHMGERGIMTHPKHPQPAL